MAYDNKQITIAVFENTRRKADNHPTKNVVVTFPDGTKFEGGLWEKESKTGLDYLSGTLRPAEEREQFARRDVPSRAPKQVSDEVDFG